MCARLLEFKGPWVSQKILGLLISPQRRLGMAVEVFGDTVVQDVVRRRLYDRPLNQEVRDIIGNFSLQLLMAQQVYEESAQQLQERLDTCNARCEPGDLYPAQKQGHLWVCNRKDSPGLSEYPVPGHLVCSLKGWRKRDWKWVSSHFSYVSNGLAAIEPAAVIGKTPEKFWRSPYGVAISKHDREVKLRKELRVYLEKVPVNGRIVLRPAIRFPLMFGGQEYIAMVAFDLPTDSSSDGFLNGFYTA